MLLTSVVQTIFHEPRLDKCSVQRAENYEEQSAVAGYGLDDRAIEIRSSAGAKGFFL
jgi:hypothetical protein